MNKIRKRDIAIGTGRRFMFLCFYCCCTFWAGPNKKKCPYCKRRDFGYIPRPGFAAEGMLDDI